jgi:ABC-2 type transport system permease protein
MSYISNIYRLGTKELWSLWRDPIMLILIIYTFTLSIYAAAKAMPDSLNSAAIAIVDEDGSQLSTRITSAFYPPHFIAPKIISINEIDRGMDMGKFTFALDIPPNFQRDVFAGHLPAIQLNVDATSISQAFVGSGYIQRIILSEVNEFVQHVRGDMVPLVDLALRIRFNQSLDQMWFGSLTELINVITMLSIILTGAAIIREREHGTIEHLLVMPVTPFEIMVAKIWSMGLVVLLATSFSITFIVQGALRVPIEGSVLLFLFCAMLHLFATTSMGIFLATVARSMPQFGILVVLILLPLEMLSGGMTPRESMPVVAQYIMSVAPTTHFVSAAKGILFRGADLKIVWPELAIITVIGAIFFSIALSRFRKTISLL